MDRQLLNWPQALEAGAKISGGKGWNLARLDHYGFEIPAGFIISAEVYSQLLTTLKECDLYESFRKTTLPIKNLKTFLLEHGLDNCPVAVRSSATVEDGINASFAGIHESYLNVCGVKAIEQAILDCYASLWSDRALSYRKKMNIDDNDLACAVVISKLVDAKASGVAFSCDPASGRDDLITINANFGLGESVVSGVTTPDEYRVYAHHQDRIDKQLGSKHKKTVTSDNGTTLIDQPNAATLSALNDEQIKQLSRLVLRVFHTLGRSEQHQDTEWVFDGDKFLLTQARPVTALTRPVLPEVAEYEEVWTAGNIRDAAPMVLPTLSSGFCYRHINDILRYVALGAGYVLPEGINFSRCYEGRYYCNATLLQWLMYDLLDMPPRLTNMNLGGHHPPIEIDFSKHDTAIKKLKRAGRGLKFIRYIDQHKKQAEKIFSEARHFIDDMMQKDISSLSDKQVLQLFYTVEKRLLDYNPIFITLTSASGAIFVIIQMLEKKLGETQAPIVANALLAGGANITTADQGYRIFELAELLEKDNDAREWFMSERYQPKQWQELLPDDSIFKTAFTDYLKEYGHRAVYEIDFTRPRWNEDPSYLLDSIKNAIGKSKLKAIKAKQQENTALAWNTVNETCNWIERKVIRTMVKRSLKGAEVREMAKSMYVAYLSPMRRFTQELGKRFAAKGIIKEQNDIIHCDMSEVAAIANGEWHGDTLANIVDERKQRQKRLEALSPPDVLINDAPQRALANPASSNSRQMLGVAVAPGRAEGKAHIAITPEQGLDMEDGYVLVAPSTDPGWTPLFLHASALVMETGGYLSHGSIVAREYGIPAVVNIPGAMSVIQNGTKLKVNGDLGTVEITAPI